MSFINSMYTINIKGYIIKLINNLAIAGNVDGSSSNLNLVIIGLVVVVVILITVTLFSNNK